MKTRDLLIWVIVVLAVVTGLGVWFFISLPSNAQVTVAVRPLTPLSTAKIDASALQGFTSLETNGVLPVAPALAVPPRNDPFTGS